MTLNFPSREINVGGCPGKEEKKLWQFLGKILNEVESIDQHNFENVLMQIYMGEDSFFVKREYKEWNKIEMEILSNDLILIFERYLHYAWSSLLEREK